MFHSWRRDWLITLARQWGMVLVNAASPISGVQPRPVELWLHQLNLSPNSKSHVRGMVHLPMEFAMWSGALEVARNPIDLVVVKGSTKRTRQPRSIAVQQKLMRHSDIRTRMNLYGDVVTDEMAQAHSKVVGLALSTSD